ncbi:hypothetical protein DFH07DRAFT_812541 [Mycena maculata]|uniref:Uncharacterized protein n=1 Tax=Mycena maculata TaxID=230809 RepID=A0AAD7JFW8_9AGAR|nr:hypothetical protein DFH07DRAFT_812541 [Mycena maculata]
MDSETQPLLSDVAEAGLDHAHPEAGPSQSQHICARCSSELEWDKGNKESKANIIRRILICAAIVFSVTIFALAVAEMSTDRRFRSPSILQLFVALWADVTITMLIILVYMGRRRDRHHKLGRTSVQIHVLCALAFSWIVFMLAMTAENSSACEWGTSKTSCKLFTAVRALSWSLIVILFSAAYATYRRAVIMHGTNMVIISAPPPQVAAWRLSYITDGGGAIKI